ncbi:MAG TPA: type II secretion system protein [Deltaproteobacteria bacterium]|jgi:type II secretion system protein I|nr:type II secretion system protein [Deltaproteobacteria bacterium]HOI07475.1 type II secretion system protein [Deltaproteobacteria bacterium]
MRSRGGFTLIEVLIAMVILGIAFTVLIGATNQSVDMATRSKFITTSTLLAQKRIAEVVSSNSLQNTGTNDGDFGEDHQGYTYVENIETTQLDGCYRYTLTVKWGEKNALETQFTIFLSPK